METKSIEEVDQNAKWVIKSYKNKGVSKITFDKWNLFNIRDKSIGIHYGIYHELPFNVSDDYLKQLPNNFESGNIRQIKYFINDLKINDWIIIAKGKYDVLYYAQIASSYYYHELDDDHNNEFCRHRRRLKNIFQIDSNFKRKAMLNTIIPYNSIYS